jgi:tetratricopeptide (TPR) repeat protein
LEGSIWFEFTVEKLEIQAHDRYYEYVKEQYPSITCDIDRLHELILSFESMHQVLKDNITNLLWSLGVYYAFMRENDERAHSCFLRLSEIEPEEYLVWYNLGVALGKLGRYEEAIKVEEKSLSIKEDAETWYNLGVSFGELEKHQEAITAFEKAIAIKDDYAKAWYNLGISLVELGKHQEAIKAYKRAIGIKDDAETWFNLGIALAKLDKYEKAIKAFEKVKILDSTIPVDRIIEELLKK